MSSSFFRFLPQRRAEVHFPAKNCARRGHWNCEMTRNHFGLSSFPGTRRAQEHDAAFHLAPVKKNCDPTNHQHRNADIKPHEGAFPRRFAAIVGSASKSTAADPALAEKSIVMSLNQMRLHLPHRV